MGKERAVAVAVASASFSMSTSLSLSMLFISFSLSPSLTLYLSLPTHNPSLPFSVTAYLPLLRLFGFTIHCAAGFTA